MKKLIASLTAVAVLAGCATTNGANPYASGGPQSDSVRLTDGTSFSN